MPRSSVSLCQPRTIFCFLHRCSLLALIIACGGDQPAAQTNNHVRFTNLTDKAGIKFLHYPGNKGIAIIREVFGPGLCVADLDGDGWQDIYFVNGRDLYARGISVRNALYHNNGDGTFTDITDNARVPGTGYGLGRVGWADENDGCPDLLVPRLR